ncbi:hypothetical protein [Phytoactinopolyspora halophila]|uniref:hypothetical protein n=1 Tax=Phytoactinopolyspora halophila TaxID=1981511 RepID=UPI001B8C5C13|nr:hypothetical protein [Phytoactinopolyspora halophila]
MHDESPNGTSQADDNTGNHTGDPAVDEALRTLRGLDQRPVHEHVSVIERAHQALHERLADEPEDEVGDGAAVEPAATTNDAAAAGDGQG